MKTQLKSAFRNWYYQDFENQVDFTKLASDSQDDEVWELAAERTRHKGLTLNSSKEMSNREPE